MDNGEPPTGFKRQDATRFLSFKATKGCIAQERGLAGTGRFLGRWPPSYLCGCWELRHKEEI